ncbi:GNAT family N-acetyltransferase [Shewanella abyssi]|uniref:GNAT family N-acetyltransferase n=1 Tax=Shewanella abyssi TaxID=311789 RepID=UPI00200CBCEE|nr:GNAT family N-acetyltransferase [Shewanella abyssi]MCL1048288.1 GNAT family N-acetyltransferase [Shewanella abyssi]
MLEIKKVESLVSISELKGQFFALATAPLDGMWHFGFVPMSDHFGFYEDQALVGYCCINADRYMLQYYLSPLAKTRSRELFTLIAQQNSAVIGTVKGAFVSTTEPEYLSLCLDNSTKFVVNSLMYQLSTASITNSDVEINMALATPEMLVPLVAFAVESIGAPEQWLTGYYSNLIQRQELWVSLKGEHIIATGECRKFDDYQTDFVDLGMIVAKNERGQGIATKVLGYLINVATRQGLKPICSTESDNVGAQKAMVRAGLVSNNRLIQIEFIQD